EKVIVLVTDGEDLEGDPVAVAESAAADHIRVSVVQIGTRAPEPIPAIDENGTFKGIRRTQDGKPLTTSLSVSGEAQLAQIAERGGGIVVRAEGGNTGIEAIASSLKRMMTEELSERVETVYADIFHYPLALGLVLLLLEAFVPAALRRAETDPLAPAAKEAR